MYDARDHTPELVVEGTLAPPKPALIREEADPLTTDLVFSHRRCSELRGCSTDELTTLLGEGDRIPLEEFEEDDAVALELVARAEGPFKRAFRKGGDIKAASLLTIFDSLVGAVENFPLLFPASASILLLLTCC